MARPAPRGPEPERPLGFRPFCLVRCDPLAASDSRLDVPRSSLHFSDRSPSRQLGPPSGLCLLDERTSPFLNIAGAGRSVYIISQKGGTRRGSGVHRWVRDVRDECTGPAIRLRLSVRPTTFAEQEGRHESGTLDAMIVVFIVGIIVGFGIGANPAKMAGLEKQTN